MFSRDQNGTEFLGQLKNFARGLLAWVNEEGNEGEHVVGDQEANNKDPIDKSLHRAAGNILIEPNGGVLFLKRNSRDHQGEWGLPGGYLEEGEEPQDAAIRESREELGDAYQPGKLALVDSRTTGDVNYTTFMQQVGSTFEPQLNEEHLEFKWAPLTEVPHPLHPGLKTTVDNLLASDPPVSEAQRKAMHAAAGGKSTLGIPQSVGKEFAEADPGGTLPEKKAKDIDLGERFEIMPNGERLIDKNTGITYNIDDAIRALFGSAGDNGVAMTHIEKPQMAKPDKPMVPGERPDKPPDLTPHKDEEMTENNGWRTPRFDNYTGRDAGTSEGARKAAQSRKSGGGAALAPAKPASRSQLEAIMRDPNQTKTWTPETWRMMGEVHKSSKDAGTSEGAKKAAQSRRSGGGSKEPPGGYKVLSPEEFMAGRQVRPPQPTQMERRAAGSQRRAEFEKSGESANRLRPPRRRPQPDAAPPTTPPVRPAGTGVVRTATGPMKGTASRDTPPTGAMATKSTTESPTVPPRLEKQDNPGKQHAQMAMELYRQANAMKMGTADEQGSVPHLVKSAGELMSHAIAKGYRP